MKQTLILLCVTVLVLSSCARKLPEIPVEHRVRYGGALAPELEKTERAYLDQLIEEEGGESEAYERLVREAERYLGGGYPELAMRQVNRVWLLRPEDADTFYQFGNVLAAQGLGDAAIQHYVNAVQLDQTHALAACLLAQMYQEKAVYMLRHRKPGFDRPNHLMGEAYVLYRQASLNATEDKELSYIYYKWAVWFAVNGDFKSAWEKVELSKKHGGEYIDPRFIELISQEYSPPRKELLEEPLFDELPKTPAQAAATLRPEETPEGVDETP